MHPWRNLSPARYEHLLVTSVCIVAGSYIFYPLSLCLFTFLAFLHFCTITAARTARIVEACLSRVVLPRDYGSLARVAWWSSVEGTLYEAYCWVADVAVACNRCCEEAVGPAWVGPSSAPDMLLVYMYIMRI